MRTRRECDSEIEKTTPKNVTERGACTELELERIPSVTPVTPLVFYFHENRTIESDSKNMIENMRERRRKSECVCESV